MKRARKKTRLPMISLLPLHLFVMSTIGCNYNDLKNPGNTSGPRSGSVIDGTPQATVDYATVRQMVFEPACLKCHGAVTPKGNVRLDTHAFASAAAQKIRTAVSAGDMPPPPPKGTILSPEQQALLFAWIDSGAPEKTVTSTPAPGEIPPGEVPPETPPEIPPGPTEPPLPTSGIPDFAYVSAKVFVPHCLKCHSSDERKGKVDLEIYSEAIKHSSEIEFSLDIDDMPRKAPPLPPELKKIVYDWIAAGTPEFVP